MNVWEEENYIELKKNCLNSNVLELGDIILNTKIDSTGNEWIDIGKIRKWVKRCPTCGKIKLCFLSQYKTLKGKNCNSCCCRIRNVSEEMRKKVSISKMGTNNHFYGLTGKNNPANRPEVKIKLKEYQNRPETRIPLGEWDLNFNKWLKQLK